MRRALIVVIINIIFVVTDLWPAAATQQLRTIDLMTPDSVLRWINGYRQKPDPSSVPDVVKALSRMSAFKDPESAGPYVGFIAGVIGSQSGARRRADRQDVSAAGGEPLGDRARDRLFGAPGLEAPVARVCRRACRRAA